MRILILLAWLVAAGPVWAADAIVRDGDTIQLGNIIYRMAGIDAPELDQTCLDEHADVWACGTETRDQLVKLIAQREVRCEDLGPDSAFKNRRVGLCSVVGESISLNQLLLRQGFAVAVDPVASKGFTVDEAQARERRQGLWKGCFVAPADFRKHETAGALLGGACPADKDRELRAALFPEDLVMPPGCNIRAKLARRARMTGHVGIYLTPQCQNYATQPKPDRWFCSEEEAQAAFYRKAFNCRAISRRN
ncbi:thermonuclease family protein [Tardiphaga sp.]|jgi:endonuclease YncB( thermonuclease family)|uniref:thermonuclease family protein n=1 Tax=Tardiphaga sp. TaxID=1926292 RepID=UPI0025E7DD9E|nr:thermonuclease family protein [Tardiphaga sp.]